MVKRVSGIIISSVITLVGALLILNSFSGMTGFIIAESVGGVASTVLGLVLFIGGILLFVYEGNQEEFVSSVDNIVDLYDIGKIDSMTAVERINKLRAGKQIEGVRYSGGRVAVIGTRRGEIPVTVNDQEKALDLVSAIYWAALVNDRSNIKKSKIEIASGKIPLLDELKGGLTQYMTQYSKEHMDDLRKLARSGTQ